MRKKKLSMIKPLPKCQRGSGGLEPDVGLPYGQYTFQVEKYPVVL